MSKQRLMRSNSSSTGLVRAASLFALALLLPGCPLSDEYFVEGAAPHPPIMGMAGRAGSDMGLIATGGMSGTGDRTQGGRGGSAQAPSLPDYCEVRQYGGHAYVLCLPQGPERANHLDASQRCVSYAEAAQVGAGSIMDLVVLDSDEEDRFVVDWVSGATRDPGLIWIGATDIIREQTWVWGRAAGTTQFFTQGKDGGEPFMDRYNDFADHRPDGTAMSEQDCGAFDSSLDWQWDDERCSEQALGFVCEEVSQ